MKFKQFCQELEDIIKITYESGVMLEEAEKLAARFLYAQMKVSEQLKNADLDARMKKSGVKALRANAYLNEVQGKEKKPTEAQIAATIDTNELVATEQRLFDTAEVERDELQRYYDIFQNAHVYYRNIAKGNFGG